jgi:predicted permease
LHQSISAWLRVIGRLRPGATVAGMSPRLTTVLRQWLLNESGYPPDWMPDLARMIPKQNIRVVPAGAGVAEMKEDYSRSLQILLTVCGLVLLIACANIANLLLARGMARRSQTAVRVAVGASRAHLIRQSLIESVLLAVAGGIAGLLVADGAGRLILSLAFHSAHFLPISTAPSLPVLAFAFLLSLVTGLVFGVAPAWFATRTDPVEALRGAGRSTREKSSLTRRLLLVTQAALSIVLVAGAAMLTRSLNNLERQDFGIQTANRITINLNSPPATYTPDHLNALYRDLEDRLKQVPGVQYESLALYNPFTDNWGDEIFVQGHPAPGLNENANSSWDRVSTGYFQAVGQPILRGRGFMESDSGTAAPVAVVNETFVRRFFPKEDPLDRHFGIDMAANAGMYRIVGVVRDAKYTDPGSPTRPMFFVPLTQYVTYKHDLLQKIELRSHFIGGAMVVTRGGLGNLEPVLRKSFSDADPNFTITSVRSLQEQIDLNFDQQRAVAGLAGLFGIVALTLAAVGLYGITAYAVAQRTGEIGVRMALGAGRINVIQLVLRSAFQNVAFGLLLGIPLAVAAGRLISNQLYGVVNWDPAALLVAIGSLGVCAFVASIIPALRAASIAPLDALRTE